MTPRASRTQRGGSVLAAAGWLSLGSLAPAQAPAPAPGQRPDQVLSQVQRSQLRERALELLQTATASPEPLLRANALEGLHAAPTRAEPAVRAALADDNPGVRFAGVMTVAELKLKRSAPFVEPLLNDPDPRVRAGAILATWRTGGRTDPTPLGDMLRHTDPRVRGEAARVLGEMGNRSAVPMLRAAAAQTVVPAPADGAGRDKALAFQLERVFQLQVAEALAKLDDPGAADSLRAALYPSSREGFESAALAAQMLGGLKDPKAIGQLVDLIEQVTPGSPVQETDPRKREYLQPREVRLAAAGALARMGFPDGLYVADMYVGDEDPAVRAQAAFVYAWSGKLDRLGTLEALMDDPDPLVAVSAASAALRLMDRVGR